MSAARSLCAGGLRRDDRRRRGVPCGEGRARIHRRGDRLRRYQAVGGERRGDSGCLEHHPDRHRAVEARCGATDTINSSNADPVEMVKQRTGGGVPYSFEAIGTKTTAGQSFQMLRAAP
jgi:Zinc-binding dehydrogenase